jgi:hypothetical protein
MIARHEAETEKVDVWTRLSMPLPSDAIQWRQDGKPITREGRHLARFVAYVDANTVRERLDAVVPGEWDLTLELLPAIPADDGEGPTCSFKARLQILGVIREDVGTGKDYKQAATDAFKRAAVRFGIAHELYDYEQNWVAMDSEGKFARPLEDPAAAYARRIGRTTPTTDDVPNGNSVEVPAMEPAAEMTPSCPKCGGRMWDNRITKRNPKAPDFKCRDRSCDGVIWPPRPAATAATRTATTPVGEPTPAMALDSSPLIPHDDIPF